VYFSIQRLRISALSSTATATTDLYTLSLHDALPISPDRSDGALAMRPHARQYRDDHGRDQDAPLREHPEGARPRIPYSCGHGVRSEEHTSELQSHLNLVCRLLLEKKNKKERHQHETI